MQAMATANFRVFKEPQGFIKVIEVIIAIFAFATTCGFSSYTQFMVKCGGTIGDKTINLPFSYPFRLHEDPIPLPICSDTHNTTTHPYGDFSAPSQFFVFIGVVCFLYCLGAIILYVFFDNVYRNNDKIPIIDFIVSVVITLCWLICSAAWAHGLAELKFYSDPASILKLHVPECMVATDEKCTTTDGGNYAGLNVSIIFGFLNLAVWAGNLWFLFKETSWFKVRSKPADPAQADPTVPDVDPQQV